MKDVFCDLILRKKQKIEKTLGVILSNPIKWLILLFHLQFRKINYTDVIENYISDYIEIS